MHTRFRNISYETYGTVIEIESWQKQHDYFCHTFDHVYLGGRSVIT
jgi:hypothetical protein